ncbi:MAG TPA: macro domain-containing protein [Thermoleophilia bacterium]|nr:macro domain-containing protein [Thermoleophilia bacterium]HQG54877.1 macro domain-containing protein [Thermoleophilia bacterium]HQJ98113.1 macro domain-containing protein [Thermoleophilia bacterium]
MKTSIGKTYLESVPGDITQLPVDAVVNAAATDLRMEAGVAGAIKRAFGEGVEREALAVAPIAPGEAVATTAAGHPTVKWVIHTAVMGPDVKPDAATIAKATRSALEVADRCHARSVALPALGAGVGGFPLYQCASVMLAETVRYLKDHPKTGLRRIVFSTYSDAAKAAFKNAMAGISRY